MSVLYEFNNFVRIQLLYYKNLESCYIVLYVLRDIQCIVTPIENICFIKYGF